MAVPRFLADHDVNEHIVDGTIRREPRVEIVRARDLGLDGLPDSQVLAEAARLGLLVISHDVNTMPAAFYARQAAGEAVPGLLMVRQTLPVARAVESIVLIWSASDAEEWAGVVAFLPL